MQSTELKLTTGDLVKLKEPYLGRYTYGIVVEIIAHTGGRRSSGWPRNVSLHLYDDQGQLFIHESYVAKGLMIPSYVDFHVSELIWYKRAAETGYNPIANPPDWDDERYLR